MFESPVRRGLRPPAGELPAGDAVCFAPKVTDPEAREKMSSEALWLFKQLNLHLELEGRFQPREKGLSLIERAAEVRGDGEGREIPQRNK